MIGAWPRTFWRALVAPVTLIHAAADSPRVPAPLFAAVALLSGWLLSIAFGANAVFHDYRFGSAMATVAEPLAALPGGYYLWLLVWSAIGLGLHFLVVALAFAMSRQSVGVAAVGRLYGYYAGGLLMLSLLALTVVPHFYGAIYAFTAKLFVILPYALFAVHACWILLNLANLGGRAAGPGLAAGLLGFLIVWQVISAEELVFETETTHMVAPSMAPTLPMGAVAMANLTAREWRLPERGDLVLFTRATSQGIQADWVRRVVAVPGDEVTVREGRLFLAGRAATAPDMEELPGGRRYGVRPGGSDGESLVVPAGHVYVLADNRDGAEDSRTFGPLPVSLVRGWVYYRLQPEPGRLY